MNKTKLNIDNLTQLWTIAGAAFQNYVEAEGICISQIENAEWPNRIWADGGISEAAIQKIKTRMQQSKALTFSNFNEKHKDNPLINKNDFTLKSVQYGMSLPLKSKFPIKVPLDFKKVENKPDAEIWSTAFYKAFNYKISAETVLKTKNDIQYFIISSEEELVGTLVFFITNQVAGIHSLGIIPTKRKQGFASQIMHQILNTAIDQNLSLATLQASEMAKAMYLKMGFSIDFIMENFQLKH